MSTSSPAQPSSVSSSCTSAKEAHLNFTREFFASDAVGKSKKECKMAKVTDVDINRFYVKIFFGEKATIAQIDSGADFSVISANVADLLDKNWRSRKSAGTIKLTGVTGSSMNVLDSKFFEISFAKNMTFPHLFVVVQEQDTLLLSSHLMYDQQLGIHWDRKNDNPFLTWESIKGKVHQVSLHPSPFQLTAKLAEKVELEPGEKRVLSFRLEKDSICGFKTAIVSNIANQSGNDLCQNVLVCPSYSDVEGNICKAMVKNFSKNKEVLEVASLGCIVEQGDSSLVLDSLSDEAPEALDKMLSQAFDGGEESLWAQGVANLSPEIHASLNRVRAELDCLTSSQTPDKEPFAMHADRCADIGAARAAPNGPLLGPRNNSASDGVDLAKAVPDKPVLGPLEFPIPEGGYEPSEKEKEDMLCKLYPEEKDKADFDLVPGTDLGFDFEPVKSVWKQYDPSLTPEKFSPFVKKLIADHESLFSRSDLDCQSKKCFIFLSSIFDRQT